MMEQPTIDNPRLWRLALEVSPGMLHAVMTSTVADASLIYRRLPLDASLPLHRALEEVVYANPELLSDFGRIDMLVDTDAYTVVPEGLGIDAATIGEITQIGYGGKEPPAVTADAPTSAVSVVWAMPEDARQFMARTFRNAPARHVVSLLLKYFGRQDGMSNRAKVFVHITDGTPRRVDIAAYDAGGRLAMATSKQWESDTDVLYYALACAKVAGFDAENDEMLLCGDRALRHAVTPLLSRYVRHVMPMIFPSAALRAGKEAFKAPFPLIILPLCE